MARAGVVDDDGTGGPWSGTVGTVTVGVPDADTRSTTNTTAMTTRPPTTSHARRLTGG